MTWKSKPTLFGYVFFKIYFLDTFFNHSLSKKHAYIDIF